MPVFPPVAAQSTDKHGLLAVIKVVPAFVILYGLMQSFGNAGPGDMLGLTSAESYATAVRGTCYGFSAAIGKVGAVVGTQTFTPIKVHLGQKYTFIVAACCGVLGMLVTFFFIRNECVPQSFSHVRLWSRSPHAHRCRPLSFDTASAAISRKKMPSLRLTSLLGDGPVRSVYTARRRLSTSRRTRRRRRRTRIRPLACKLLPCIL
jgi:MFS family permease